ncbi:hypothetical protein GQ457_01G035340 [Hibiscus cannabinus]
MDIEFDCISRMKVPQHRRIVGANQRTLRVQPPFINIDIEIIFRRFDPLYWLDIPFCEAIGLKGVNGTKHIFFIPESEWNKSHIERCTIMHIFPI